MVVPSPPLPPGSQPMIPPLDKEALRRAALDARKAFVGTLSDADRALHEDRLARMLRPLTANARTIGGYSPLGSEISAEMGSTRPLSGGSIRR